MFYIDSLNFEFSVNLQANDLRPPVIVKFFCYTSVKPDFSQAREFFNCLYFFFKLRTQCLKVHKNENFFGFDFEFCTISLLVMHK